MMLDGFLVVMVFLVALAFLWLTPRIERLMEDTVIADESATTAPAVDLQAA